MRRYTDMEQYVYDNQVYDDQGWKGGRGWHRDRIQ